jgi:pimeloyl-ACP methyl ester carboxylesterase
MPYVKINNHNIFYEEHGSGDNVILFGHSYLWDSKMWHPQVKHLSKKYRCIVPDLWGHGNSDSPVNANYSLESLAADHLGIMDALGIDKFSIVGISVGGMWALHIALQSPERVQALVLMDTGFGAEPAVEKARYFAMIEMAENSGKFPPQLIDMVYPIFFSQATMRNKPDLVNDFQHSLSLIMGDQMPSVAALGRCIFSRPDVTTTLRNIHIPTHVIVGKDDIARPIHESQLIADSINGAKLSIIENAGHAPNVEQPAQVNEILDSFFQTVFTTDNITA